MYVNEDVLLPDSGSLLGAGSHRWSYIQDPSVPLMCILFFTAHGVCALAYRPLLATA
jgi:hypothetical protein